MMIKLIGLTIILSFIHETYTLSCLDIKLKNERACLELEKENYVHCVRARMKRYSQECESGDECQDCDCQSCSYSQCEGQCSECCNSCCDNYVQCHTNHCCHKQCHAECRNYNCRSACRRSCYDTVQREKGVQKEIVYERMVPGGGSGQISLAKQDATVVNNTNKHNISTIINLTNVINNTNILDVPINLTYTNKNNITLRGEKGGDGDPAALQDGCCIVIGPRHCVPTQVFPFTRCFHTRSRQCGSFCSANIVHEESRQVCNSVNGFGQPTNCQEQRAYIPQPQPRCTYTSAWPYVTCGIQPPVACEGCYEHYFKQQQEKKVTSCAPQCYDDFSVGPLYRQGPFYQPGYPYTPPCTYSPVGCNGYYGGMGGYGFGGGMGAGGYWQFPGMWYGGFNPGLVDGEVFSPGSSSSNSTSRNLTEQQPDPRLFDLINTRISRHSRSSKKNLTKVEDISVVAL